MPCARRVAPRLAENPGLAYRHREHLGDIAAAERVLQHRCLTACPRSSQVDSTAAHAQVGVDDAGALQVGQAPSELALNSAGFTPLAFANALRIGSSRPVYVAGLLRREPRIAPWSMTTTSVAAGDRALDQRALAGVGDAGDDAQHPERDVDVDVPQVVRGRAADLQRAGRGAHRLLEGRPVAEVAAGGGVAGPQPSTVPSKQTVPPAVPAPGPRSTTWSAIAIVPACARRRARCCPCRAAAAAGRSSARCRAGAGRWWARRRRR